MQRRYGEGYVPRMGYGGTVPGATSPGTADHVLRPCSDLATRYPLVGVKPLAHSADAVRMSLAERASRAPVFARRKSDVPRRRATDTVVTGPIGPQPLRRERDGWLDRWMETVADLARLKDSHPMLD